MSTRGKIRRLKRKENNAKDDENTCLDNSGMDENEILYESIQNVVCND